MDSATGQNNKGKKIALSILASVGYAIVGLFVGTIITGILLGLLMVVIVKTTGAFSEVGPDLVIILSPICGLLPAIVIGILGGRWTYKRLSEGK